MQGWDLKGPLASHSRLASQIICSQYSLLWLHRKRKKPRCGFFLLLTHSLLRRSCTPQVTPMQKEKPTRLGWFPFWMQGWDLNLTTSGLWARRATICSTLRYIIKCGAGNGNRTRTVLSYHGILSPGRLPISPPRLNLSPILATYTFNCLNSITHKNLFVNTLFLKIIDFFCFCRYNNIIISLYFMQGSALLLWKIYP